MMSVGALAITVGASLLLWVKSLAWLPAHPRARRSRRFITYPVGDDSLHDPSAVAHSPTARPAPGRPIGPQPPGCARWVAFDPWGHLRARPHPTALLRTAWIQMLTTVVLIVVWLSACLASGSAPGRVVLALTGYLVVAVLDGRVERRRASGGASEVTGGRSPGAGARSTAELEPTLLN